MQDLKKLYPAAASMTYLNTASCGLLSKPLVEWRKAHDQKLLQDGSLYRDLHKAHIKEIRESVARFFTARTDEVALVPNFSFGINVILDAMSKGKKVLLLNSDYPSVNWPFEHRDFDVSYAEIDENLEDNILEAISKYQPDVLALSLVQYISGLKIDLSFVKRLKQQQPSLFIIADGTQFLGTERFSFLDSGIDVLGASCYKWMLSGYGNALFMVRKEAQKLLHSSTIGFNSADAQFSKRDALEFVGHMEPGHQDTLNYGSLGESILFFESLGVSAIENHLADLCGKAFQAFKKRGLLLAMVANRPNHSTIFNLKGDMSLFQKLQENGIVCSLRGKGIRVSFHIYNSEEDLIQLLKILDGQSNL